MNEEDKISHLNLQDFQADLGYKKGMEVGIRMGKMIATKDMVDKACEYLRCHIDKDLVIYHEQSWKSLGQFINDFRKAMED